MGDETKVDEFHKHELMDRADFLMQIFTLLNDHPAHTEATRKAFDAAGLALAEFYGVAARECFEV